MSDLPIDYRLLVDRYLDDALDRREAAELSRLIETRPEVAAYFAEASQLYALLHEHETARIQPHVGDKGSGKGESETARLLYSASPEKPEGVTSRDLLEKKPSARLLLKSVPAVGPRRYVIAGLVAAGLLFAVLVVLTLLSPGVDPNVAARKHSRESGVTPPSGGSREDRQQAEALREEAEARLREIRRMQDELARSAPRADQDPGELERHKAAQKRLESDRERIERDLADAIQLAKNAESRAPESRPKEERPAPAPETPKDPTANPGTVARVATVERVEGDVSLVDTEGKRPVLAQQGVSPGQGAQTGKKSLLVLKFSDGTRLELGEETEVREVREEEGKHLFVDKGTVKALVAKQPKDQPSLFTTPHGTVKVLGTIFRLVVDLDPKKGTKVELEEGKVEVKNLAGKTLQLESGHYAVAGAGLELAAKKMEPARIPGWRNVTGSVGGNAWGPGGVDLLAVVPGRDEIIAAVSGSWLWASADGAATWRKLGSDGREPIRNEPHQLLFDPKDPRIFWVCGVRGPGIFRTQDGGQSFRRLGKLDSVDGLAVDFSDPLRRTLLATVHRGDHGLYQSMDGGKTWERIGDRIPAAKCLSSDALILDSKTFLVNSTWDRDARAIFRSQDAGRTWARVAEVDPQGPALLASDGTLYWQGLYGTGLFRSLDRGMTWVNLGAPVKTNLIEIPGGRLVGAGDQQLFVSANGGMDWEKLGDPIPIKPDSVVYSPLRRAFYVRRGSSDKVPDALFRWDTPN